ncbi:MAG: hypothetical protein R3Y55_03805 [Rikenellaceae bacterium]
MNDIKLSTGTYFLKRSEGSRDDWEECKLLNVILPKAEHGVVFRIHNYTKCREEQVPAHVVQSWEIEPRETVHSQMSFEELCNDFEKYQRLLRQGLPLETIVPFITLKSTSGTDSSNSVLATYLSKMGTPYLFDRNGTLWLVYGKKWTNTFSTYDKVTESFIYTRCVQGEEPSLKAPTMVTNFDKFRTMTKEEAVRLLCDPDGACCSCANGGSCEQGVDNSCCQRGVLKWLEKEHDPSVKPRYVLEMTPDFWDEPYCLRDTLYVPHDQCDAGWRYAADGMYITFESEQEAQECADKLNQKHLMNTGGI